jgi:hypothetical protein
MATRRNLLFNKGPTRLTTLLKEAKGPTRREALMKIMGPLPWIITKGRPFHVTRKGVFIVRVDGKSLYGRKSKACSVPTKRCKN